MDLNLLLHCLWSYSYSLFFLLLPWGAGGFLSAFPDPLSLPLVSSLVWVLWETHCIKRTTSPLLQSLLGFLSVGDISSRSDGGGTSEVGSFPEESPGVGCVSQQKVIHSVPDPNSLWGKGSSLSPPGLDLRSSPCYSLATVFFLVGSLNPAHPSINSTFTPPSSITPLECAISFLLGL